MKATMPCWQRSRRAAVGVSAGAATVLRRNRVLSTTLKAEVSYAPIVTRATVPSRPGRHMKWSVPPLQSWGSAQLADQMQRCRSLDNQCGWKYLGGRIGRGVLVEPPPETMKPCSDYLGCAGRLPHAPR